MQFQKKEKRQTTVRFDSHHVRLRTGEVQRKTGSYMYRWTDKLGKRNTIYAATLEDLREQEEQILVDQHDGIKANIKNVTMNDVYELWCQLKRGIKDSTMKNYIYMYELFVKPTFGKKKLVQVKKSDVRRFYNQLILLSFSRTKTIPFGRQSFTASVIARIRSSPSLFLRWAMWAVSRIGLGTVSEAVWNGVLVL